MPSNCGLAASHGYHKAPTSSGKAVCSLSPSLFQVFQPLPFLNGKELKQDSYWNDIQQVGISGVSPKMTQKQSRRKW